MPAQAGRDRARWLSNQLIAARMQEAREANGHVDENTAPSRMLEQYESRVNESAGPLTDDTHLSEPLRQRTERLRNTGRAAGWIIDPAEVRDTHIHTGAELRTGQQSHTCPVPSSANSSASPWGTKAGRQAIMPTFGHI